jgi:hypothetical protein
MKNDGAEPRCAGDAVTRIVIARLLPLMNGKTIAPGFQA